MLLVWGETDVRHNRTNVAPREENLKGTEYVVVGEGVRWVGVGSKESKTNLMECGAFIGSIADCEYSGPKALMKLCWPR